MLGGLISYALLAALATALLIAAVTDVRRREINNWLNISVAALAPVYWLTAGLDWRAIVFQLLLCLVTFVIACVLFAMRQMGGGDVKLLTALALWFAPLQFGQLIAIMAMIGGAASIAMAVFNMRRLPSEAFRNELSTFVAAAWVLGACGLAYGYATGEPIIPPTAMTAMLDSLPSGWVLWPVCIILLAIFLSGMRHIFRRQTGAIAIPYGVAISGAGLWVLGKSLFVELLT